MLNGRSRLTRRGALVAGVSMAGLAACSDETGTVETASEDEGAQAEGTGTPVQLTVTPADGATDATAATEIGWTVEAGSVTAVALSDAAGNAVEGGMHPDGTTWVPATPLAWETSYTATVTAENESGEPVTAESTFTTIASPADRVIENYLPGPDSVVGQAAVLAFRFESGFEVPEDSRAAVERRLLVTSEPAQEGSWHWVTGRALEYRPKEYWQPNTAVTVRLGLGGLPLGGGRYGEFDESTAFAIDAEARLLEADDATKQLTAYLDGEAVQTMPISLGAAEIDGVDTRSYSGQLTIMSREQEANFFSAEFGYDIDVKWAMRLTFSGQYIHGAPWAAERLGKENGSHGCINVSDEMGEWIYNFVRWGDPVVVKNTGLGLPQGDGFTTWDLSWEDHLAGSYLNRQ